MACSICFEPFRKPVVTPCGHIFCTKCLIAASASSPDATKAPCPTCRNNFSLVHPNEMFIPEKYRDFMDSGIRRIYLDNSAERGLQKVAELERKVRSLEMDKERLTKRCESYTYVAISHADKEKQALLNCERLKKELNQAKISISELVAKNEAQRRNTLHTSHIAKKSLRSSDNATETVQVPVLRGTFDQLTETNSSPGIRTSDKPTETNLSTPLPELKKRNRTSPIERPIAPLPKRLRLIRSSQRSQNNSIPSSQA